MEGRRGGGLLGDSDLLRHSASKQTRFFPCPIPSDCQYSCGVNWWENMSQLLNNAQIDDFLITEKPLWWGEKNQKICPTSCKGETKPSFNSFTGGNLELPGETWLLISRASNSFLSDSLLLPSTIRNTSLLLARNNKILNKPKIIKAQPGHFYTLMFTAHLASSFTVKYKTCLFK